MRTISTLGEAPVTPEAGGPCPQLFRVLEAGAPLASPSRHRLDRVAEVTIGRAAALDVARGDRLRLGVADPWMSSAHARLVPVLHRWTVEDAGSRNGTLVNGERIDGRRVLCDGDVIEIGHTFFVFRDTLVADGADVVVDRATCEPGLATLRPDLGADLTRVGRVARTTEPVLIGGETGTGKELMARAVHAASGRTGRLVAVNCGALPETLAEGELFGHRRGAFSGAAGDRPGLVRSADGGTLFLDEIADLRAPSQAALLRVLQEQEVMPLGADRAEPVDVRIVAASHRGLVEQVEAGRFRADLYARLRGFALTVPALRERREDVGLILATLLERRGAGDVRLARAAARALLAYRWPHNVRELDKVVGAALALAVSGEIQPGDLPADVASAAFVAVASPRALGDRELGHRAELARLLRDHDGNIAAVARVLGKGRMQIHRWIERYDLDPEAYRPVRGAALPRSA